MSDDTFFSDDPTEPIRQPASPQEDQPGNKLVIGSFQDASKQQKRPGRKQYQNPNAQNARNEPYIDQPTQRVQPQQRNEQEMYQPTQRVQPQQRNEQSADQATQRYQPQQPIPSNQQV